MSKSVINSYGVELDWDFAVTMMDNDVREDLHMSIAPCTEQKFFNAYVDAHQKKFGEVWELSKSNPIV